MTNNYTQTITINDEQGIMRHLSIQTTRRNTKLKNTYNNNDENKMQNPQPKIQWHINVIQKQETLTTNPICGNKNDMTFECGIHHTCRMYCTIIINLIN